ncbi:hypothetical protein TSUD_352800 [Trifolium subterraneum]|nr:hypothetical protein TSUD_352800 [Trifolium subterraneum]
MKAKEPIKILLLSLGCGVTPEPIKINSFIAYFFRATLWLPVAAKGLAIAVGDTNEYHLQTVFSSLPSSYNSYLRIEEYDLAASLNVGDNATKENMENLVRAAENLLEEPVKVIDAISFDPQEKPSEGTNAEALERFAEILYKEKQLRLEMKEMEKMKLMKKMGRPFVEVI